MDIWKGQILPLRKAGVTAGFVDFDISQIEHEPDTPEFWWEFEEQYAYLDRAVERASELRSEIFWSKRDPAEISGVLFVNIKGSTMYYWTNYQVYLDFEDSGFSISYYNDNIRIRPFPAPFPPAKN